MSLQRPIIISTETRCGDFSSLIAVASIAVIGAAATYVALPPMAELAAAGVSGLVLVGVGLLAAPPLVRRLERRGSWHIGTEHIRFDPLWRDPISIRWTDVRAVRWGRRGITIRSDVASITIGSPRLGAAAWATTRRALRDALGTRFTIGDESAGSPRAGRSATLLALAATTLLAAMAHAATGAVWPAWIVGFSFVARGIATLRAARRLTWSRPVSGGAAPGAGVTPGTPRSSRGRHAGRPGRAYRARPGGIPLR